MEFGGVCWSNELFGFYMMCICNELIKRYLDSYLLEILGIGLFIINREFYFWWWSFNFIGCWMYVKFLLDLRFYWCKCCLMDRDNYLLECKSGIIFYMKILD